MSPIESVLRSSCKINDGKTRVFLGSMTGRAL